MTSVSFTRDPSWRAALARERRRRRRRLTAAGALLLAAVVAAAAILLARHPSSAHGHPGTQKLAHTRSAPPQPISPAGYPLAKPAFALAGLEMAAGNVVHERFRSPPSEGLLFNLDTGQVLWQLHPLVRRPIASLTKMMTALLSAGEPPHAPVLITRQAIAANGSKVGVLPFGRHVPLESMLYGLMLPSGNDAAVALAQHVAGSVAAFVQRMNVEAARLGLGCTRYSSPHGFYDRGNFSCAADLAVLAHVALEQPLIAKVARTFAAVLPFPIRGGKLYLYNNNPLLIYGYPGTTGLKTGYTIAAGRCLAATAERDGVRLGVVLLHSPAPGSQARSLLDRAFYGVYHLPPVTEPPIPPEA